MSVGHCYPEQVWTIEALREAWVRARLSGVGVMEFSREWKTSRSKGNWKMGTETVQWMIQENVACCDTRTLNGQWSREKHAGFKGVKRVLDGYAWALQPEIYDIPF